MSKSFLFGVPCGLGNAEKITTGRVSINPTVNMNFVIPSVISKPIDYTNCDTDFAALGYRVEYLKEEWNKQEYIETMRPTAFGKGLIECQRCGTCCKKAPCKLIGTNLQPMADYLNLTIIELFKKYLVVDKYNGKYYVLPVRVGQEGIAGQYMSDERSFEKGACIFMKEVDGVYSCSIQEVKPKQGADYKCWEDKKRPNYSWQRNDILALGWNGKED